MVTAKKSLDFPPFHWHQHHSSGWSRQSHPLTGMQPRSRGSSQQGLPLPIPNPDSIHVLPHPPLQGQWYDIFLKGIWILNLVPPSSIDHIITPTSPSVGPGCFPNPARSQLFHWIWHHQLTETDKTLRCSGKILFSKNNWRNPFHASIIISETPNCTRGYKICKWRLHDNLVGPMCYNGTRGKCSYIEF